MIYSPDIEKKCALCLFSKKIEGDMLFCEKRRKIFSQDAQGCKKFDYDIFKRSVRRRPEFKTNVSAEDFKL